MSLVIAKEAAAAVLDQILFPFSAFREVNERETTTPVPDR